MLNRTLVCKFNDNPSHLISKRKKSFKNNKIKCA